MTTIRVIIDSTGITLSRSISRTANGRTRLMNDDPLRDTHGRFRSPTPAERLGLAITTPEPGPAPEEPPRRGPLIPAGPMGDGTPDQGDPIRAALARLNRH